MLIFALLIAFFSPPAFAEVPRSDGPAVSVEAPLFGEKKEEREEEISEAEKEALQKRKDRAARVVVLKWPDTSVDYQDETIQRNVRSRIDRADALFFPSVDLYQNGRKYPDRSIKPVDQPATVPDGNLELLRQAAVETSTLSWSDLSPGEWGLRGKELIRLEDRVWFIEKVEQREPVFLLYAMIGYAAENSDDGGPPFYEAIGGRSVTYYYYLAATMAYQDPSLLSSITNQEIKGQINFYLEQLQNDEFPHFPIDFELEDFFDKESFDKEYEVYLNGLPVDVDEEGQIQVPLGRLDIYMKRKDTGHSLSDKLVVDKFEDKAYFVRNDARKKMGIDFIDQLMLHPNECSPELDGDILNFLAIYAKLHPKAEVYIAVPRYGNPNKVFIWRYDRTSGTLQRVGGADDGYPVRFAATVGAGLLYNGASASLSPNLEDPSIADGLASGDASGLVNADYDLSAGGLPLDIQLRGHWSRLMVGFGIEHAYNLSEDGAWAEVYRTPVHAGPYADDDIRVADTGADGEPKPEALHYRFWARNIYGNVGVVLGRDAALGFGPRFSMRVGGLNAPHAVSTTAHFGYSWQPPLDALQAGDRVRPMVDFDIRGGAAWPLADSISQEKAAYPVVGFTAGIGTTF